MPATTMSHFLSLPPPARGRSDSEAVRVGVATTMTPPGRCAATLPFQGRDKKKGNSTHRLLDQLVRGFGEKRVRRFAIDGFAADLQQRRNRERRDVIERLVHDSALDARERLAEPPDIEQAGGS